jgi:cell division protein FtsW (lipid II flippase)
MLQKWFDELNKPQKILIRIAVWVLVILLINAQEDLATVLSAVIIIAWLYLEFGTQKRKYDRNK